MDSDKLLATSSRALEPIWQPCAPPSSIPMNQYRLHINNKFNLDLQNTRDLHSWSVSSPQEFWVDLWSYLGLVPDLPPTTTRAYDPKIPMNEIPLFFENASINYAENVLNQPSVLPSSPALIGLREGQNRVEQWSWEELREHVRKIRSALIRSGVKEGDRVAAVISTSVWSIAIFLASASLGAIYTSIASDLGTEGCISRLQLVNPTILFSDSHVTYKGRQRVNLDKISTIIARLKKDCLAVVIPIHKTLQHPFLSLDEFLTRSNPLDKLEFKRMAFSAPLYILYSSGTSGPPKCLVHQHGVILQHQKTSKLHNSLKPGEVAFQYSSPSWVLWNIMVGHLSAGTTLVLYDGSPTFPSPVAMLDIVQRYNVAYWGISPRYLQQLESTGVIAKETYRLPALRMVQTGGSHLAASQYHWFYQTFPRSIHLTSVIGGTDIATSWGGTDPTSPVYPGEIQIPMLGHDLDVVDPYTGESVKHLGIAGEFICRQPFPSMPIYMWGDEGNKRYTASYFDRFDFPCWAQHDWASFNPVTGGCQVHGRSDGVLNPQGIRFGSSEIYSITEAQPFGDIIETTLCVGRNRKGIDSDESVFLFVIMRDGFRFDSSLDQKLRSAIRSDLSARHVPRFIIPVKDIPVTVNGKKVETLVKQTICTGQIPNKISSTVANPQCLEDFKQYYYVEEAKLRARL